MFENKLNICQVSLNNNIPLIIENYQNFKKIYKKIKIYLICPNKQLREFKKKLDTKDIKIVSEDKIISFKEFNKVYKSLSKNINYRNQFKKRLGWYYQQILKICFTIRFIKKKDHLIIWDADTIILKKITFFKNRRTINYGNFYEYNIDYFETNKKILKRVPNYNISFLNQFIAVNKKELNFFLKNIVIKKNESITRSSKKIAKFFLLKIFQAHSEYKGSMFSEYELLGQSSYIFNKLRQKPMLFLRLNLDGKLTEIQKKISQKLNYKHVTYEHMHKKKKNQGMLRRRQSYFGFFKIIIKDLTFHYIRSFFYFFISYYHSNNLIKNQTNKNIK